MAINYTEKYWQFYFFQPIGLIFIIIETASKLHLIRAQIGIKKWALL